jgi:hypothetical protein
MASTNPGTQPTPAPNAEPTTSSGAAAPTPSPTAGQVSGLGPPSEGAPAVAPPSPDAYKVPGADDLAALIATQKAAPPIVANTSQLDATIADQKAQVSQLSAIASGTAPTQADKQVNAGVDSMANAAASSEAGYHGTQAVAQAKQTSDAQANADSRIRAVGAQLDAQQKVVAQKQMSDILSKMSDEASARSTMIQHADIANREFSQKVVGEEFSLASLKQGASLAKSAADTAYQEHQRAQAIEIKAKHDSATMHFIGGGLMAVGAVVAGAMAVVGGAVTFGAAAAPLGLLAVGLGTGAAKEFTDGASDQIASDALKGT